MCKFFKSSNQPECGRMKGWGMTGWMGGWTENGLDIIDIIPVARRGGGGVGGFKNPPP